MYQSNNFSGHLAKAPSLSRPSGTVVCKFTVLRNEYTGKDDSGESRPERVVAIQFTAFGPKAEAIAKNMMEGDQINLEYRIENNNYLKDGEKVYEYSFIVTDFEFGAPGKAKRAVFAESKD